MEKQNDIIVDAGVLCPDDYKDNSRSLELAGCINTIAHALVPGWGSIDVHRGSHLTHHKDPK
jgi:hypothetical protein